MRSLTLAKRARLKAREPLDTDKLADVWNPYTELDATGAPVDEITQDEADDLIESITNNIAARVASSAHTTPSKATPAQLEAHDKQAAHFALIATGGSKGKRPDVLTFVDENGKHSPITNRKTLTAVLHSWRISVRAAIDQRNREAASAEKMAADTYEWKPQRPARR